MSKKALFLDRDGVINIEKNYLYKIKDFEFLDGIFDLCRYFINHGYIIIVITNQSGIARKYYTEDDFAILTSWMKREFENKGIMVSKVYHCPHHPDINGKCSCRKPNTGMILQAKEDFNINLRDSVLVGDHVKDIQAGINANIGTTYLLHENIDMSDLHVTKIIKSLKEIYK